MNDLTPQLKQLLENAKRVNLSHAEKEAIRGAVEAFIHEHPKRAGGSVTSPWAGGVAFALMRPLAFALTLILVVGSGTAYAAEGALPGDALYEIKVDVIEEVRAKASFSEEAKAAWDAERAERRLTEAKLLAERGDLTEEKQGEIEERFERHVAQVEERTEAMERRGERRAAVLLLANLEAKLRGHEELLAYVAERKGRSEAEERRADVAMDTAAAPVRAVAPFAAPAAPEPILMASVEIATSSVDEGVDEVEAEQNERRSDRLAEKVRARVEHLGKVRAKAEVKLEMEKEGTATSAIKIEVRDDGNGGGPAGARIEIRNEVNTGGMIAPIRDE